MTEDRAELYLGKYSKDKRGFYFEDSDGYKWRPLDNHPKLDEKRRLIRENIAGRTPEGLLMYIPVEREYHRRRS
ncbi:hypothetical protein HYS94_04075 [Candidatus Daviesbacteria bacterium]|nr:hypothetical protein [Candidatus Daviesbacteria bacterium]